MRIVETIVFADGGGGGRRRNVHSSRNREGAPRQGPFRRVSFSDEFDTLAICANLRAAWIAVPGPDSSVEGVTAWMAGGGGGGGATSPLSQQSHSLPLHHLPPMVRSPAELGRPVTLRMQGQSRRQSSQSLASNPRSHDELYRLPAIASSQSHIGSPQRLPVVSPRQHRHNSLERYSLGVQQSHRQSRDSLPLDSPQRQDSQDSQQQHQQVQLSQSSQDQHQHQHQHPQHSRNQHQHGQNPDTERVDSPWRLQLYLLWNAAFSRVSDFLRHVVPGETPQFYSPNHARIVLRFPASATGGGRQPRRAASASGPRCVLSKKWHVDVLLVPAYLAPGANVRAVALERQRRAHLQQQLTRGGRRGGEGGRRESVECLGAERTLGTFHARDRPTEMWYIGEGTEMRFYLEGEWPGREGEIAAVLVFGVMGPVSYFMFEDGP